MKKFKLIVLVLFIGIYFKNALFAAEQTDNHLITLNDTVKIKQYFEIEDKLIKKNIIDSALYYNNICAKILEKIHVPDLQHKCYHLYVRIYHAKANYKTALEYCLKSIDIAKHNKNKFQEATSYRAIFNIYHNLYLNDSAVKYAVYSLNLTQEIKDTSNIVINYGNLCWLYMDLGKYDEAINFGLLGVKTGKIYKDTIGLLISINNLAQCYLQTKNNEKAIPLLKELYRIGYIYNRPRSIRNALFNLGTIYYYIGNKTELAKTAELLNKFNSSHEDIDIKNECNQYILNGFNLFYQRKFKECEDQLLTGLKIAESDSVIEPMLTIYLTLSKVKFAQSDFVAGNYYEDKWDDLYAQTNEKHLREYEAELQTKYEVQKKQVTIKLQEAKIREKTILFNLTIAGLLGILIISFLIFRNYQHKSRLQKQRISELETEKQLEATEAVLKGEEQERSRLAKDLHDGLGGMLSGLKYSFATMKGNLVMTPENQLVFERSMDMLDSSIKEMRRVAHNMMPEALLKFGLNTALKDFCNDIDHSGALRVNYQSIGMENITLEETMSITLYRIVQELLNNIMKHARACTAIVQITKSYHQLSLTVEDDGMGFDTNILDESKGIGWRNIKNRVDFLKGTLHITSKEEEGTSVLIELNLSEE